MTSIKKMIEKTDYQNKVNPGHKSSYDQPLRPRATVFASKKTYNRHRAKKEVREEIYEN